MNKRWIGVLPCVSIMCMLAMSCGSSDGGGPAGAGESAGGMAGSGGASGGPSGGGTAGLDLGAGAGGEVGGSKGGAAGAGAAGTSGGSEAVGGSPGDDGGSVGGSAVDDGGASGAGGAPAPVDISPLSPSEIPDLALWLDGNAQAFSDKDENFPVPADSGRVRSVPEAPPLTGSWKAPSPVERPIRELGALSLRPVESSTGYYLQDTAGSIHTDDSTIAISFRTMNSNTSQGALTARIGTSSYVLGIVFIGDIIGIKNNQGTVFLKKHVARGLHTTMIVRFSATGFDVQFDVEGFRSSESVVAPIAHDTASNFLLGYDTNLNSSMYGFVSQVVGFNRAISDVESTRLMSWLHEQPIPDVFPITKPLVAIVGDSIANGDQIPGWQTWGFRMLSSLASTRPDVQLLNDAINGTGIPTVKNSTYSERVLPWYSAARDKNILIVAAGTNDLVNGTSMLQDILDRYYGLLNAARATGWKTVACTVLPRHDIVVDGATGFEAARQGFNADLRAHSSSYDALADVAAITGMGAAGDADQTAYYTGDKIHPSAAGHALLAPVYSAAVAGLL